MPHLTHLPALVRLAAGAVLLGVSCMAQTRSHHCGHGDFPPFCTVSGDARNAASREVSLRGTVQRRQHWSADPCAPASWLNGHIQRAAASLPGAGQDAQEQQAQAMLQALQQLPRLSRQAQGRRPAQSTR